MRLIYVANRYLVAETAADADEPLAHSPTAANYQNFFRLAHGAPPS